MVLLACRLARSPSPVQLAREQSLSSENSFKAKKYLAENLPSESDDEKEANCGKSAAGLLGELVRRTGWKEPGRRSWHTQLLPLLILKKKKKKEKTLSLLTPGTISQKHGEENCMFVFTETCSFVPDHARCRVACTLHLNDTLVAIVPRFIKF